MAETSSSVSQPLQTEDEEESIVANAKSVENVKEGETGSPLVRKKAIHSVSNRTRNDLARN